MPKFEDFKQQEKENQEIKTSIEQEQDKGFDLKEDYLNYGSDHLIQMYEDRISDEKAFAERTRYYFKSHEMTDAKKERYLAMSKDKKESGQMADKFGTHRAYKRRRAAGNASDYFKKAEKLAQGFDEKGKTPLQIYEHREKMLRLRLEGRLEAAEAKAKSSDHEKYLKGKATLSCLMILKDQLVHLKGEKGLDKKSIRKFENKEKSLDREIDTARNYLQRVAPSSIELWQKQKKSGRYDCNGPEYKKRVASAKKMNNKIGETEFRLMTSLTYMYEEEYSWPERIVLEKEDGTPINLGEAEKKAINTEYTDAGDQKEKKEKLLEDALKRVENFRLPSFAELEGKNFIKLLNYRLTDYYEVLNLALPYLEKAQEGSFEKKYMDQSPLFRAKLRHLRAFSDYVYSRLLVDHGIKMNKDGSFAFAPSNQITAQDAKYLELTASSLRHAQKAYLDAKKLSDDTSIGELDKIDNEVISKEKETEKKTGKKNEPVDPFVEIIELRKINKNLTDDNYVIYKKIENSRIFSGQYYKGRVERALETKGAFFGSEEGPEALVQKNLALIQPLLTLVDNKSQSKKDLEAKKNNLSVIKALGSKEGIGTVIDYVLPGAFSDFELPTAKQLNDGWFEKILKGNPNAFLDAYRKAAFMEDLFKEYPDSKNIIGKYTTFEPKYKAILRLGSLFGSYMKTNYGMDIGKGGCDVRVIPELSNEELHREKKQSDIDLETYEEFRKIYAREMDKILKRKQDEDYIKREKAFTVLDLGGEKEKNRIKKTNEKVLDSYISMSLYESAKLRSQIYKNPVYKVYVERAVKAFKLSEEEKYKENGEITITGTLAPLMMDEDFNENWESVGYKNPEQNIPHNHNLKWLQAWAKGDMATIDEMCRQNMDMIVKFDLPSPETLNKDFLHIDFASQDEYRDWITEIVMFGSDERYQLLKNIRKFQGLPGLINRVPCLQQYCKDHPEFEKKCQAAADLAEYVNAVFEREFRVTVLPTEERDVGVMPDEKKADKNAEQLKVSDAKVQYLDSYSRFYTEALANGGIKLMADENDQSVTSFYASYNVKVNRGAKEEVKNEDANAPINKEIEEVERLEKENLEKENLEKENLEKENLEKEKLEQERIEKEKAEQERLEKEKAEQERIEKEKAEKERIEKEKAEKERIEKEKAEQERIEKEKADKAEKERLEKERLEKERIEKEKLEKEKNKNEIIEETKENLNKIVIEEKKVQKKENRVKVVKEGASETYYYTTLNGKVKVFEKKNPKNLKNALALRKALLNVADIDDNPELKPLFDHYDRYVKEHLKGADLSKYMPKDALRKVNVKGLDLEQIQLLRLKLVSGGLIESDLTGEAKELYDYYDQAIQKLRHSDQTFDDKVSQHEKREKVEYNITLSTNLTKEYETQASRSCDCWSCAGSAIYNHFIRNEKNYEALKGNQKLFRNEKISFIKQSETNLDDESYREKVNDIKAFTLDNRSRNRTGSPMGDPFAVADFYLRRFANISGYENTAVRKTTFSPDTANVRVKGVKNSNDGKVYRDTNALHNLTEKFKETIARGLSKDSALALLIGYHYYTVYGLEGDKIKVFDSLNQKNELSVSDIMSPKNRVKTVELVWLENIDNPEDVTKEFSGIDYDKETGTFKTNDLTKVTGSYEEALSHTEGVGAYKRLEDKPGDVGAMIAEGIYLPKTFKKGVKKVSKINGINEDKPVQVQRKMVPLKLEKESDIEMRKEKLINKNEILGKKGFELLRAHDKANRVYDNPALIKKLNTAIKKKHIAKGRNGSIDISRIPGALLRSVNYDTKFNPISDEDYLNEQWNLEVMTAFENGDQKKLDEIITSEVPKIFSGIKIPSPPQKPGYYWFKRWFECEVVPNCDKWFEAARRHAALGNLVQANATAKKVLESNKELKEADNVLTNLFAAINIYLKIGYRIDGDKKGDAKVMDALGQKVTKKPKNKEEARKLERIKKANEVLENNLDDRLKKQLGNVLEAYGATFGYMKEEVPDSTYTDTEDNDAKELRKIRTVDPGFTKEGYEVYKKTQKALMPVKFDPAMKDIYWRAVDKKHIKISGGASPERDISFVMRYVEYDEDYHPLTKKDEENEAFNLKWAKAFEENDVDLRDDMIATEVGGMFDGYEMFPEPTQQELDAMMAMDEKGYAAFKNKMEEYFKKVTLGDYPKYMLVQNRMLSLDGLKRNNPSFKLYLINNPQIDKLGDILGVVANLKAAYCEKNYHFNEKGTFSEEDIKEYGVEHLANRMQGQAKALYAAFAMFYTNYREVKDTPLVPFKKQKDFTQEDWDKLK